ncbi:hypothetical protein [Pseudomonas extremaustralis]|uniref:Uncharacterized protein n=1 Tax=Pseudomonas extremaustralis TaxID=359110 RepID=A0A5C5Q7G9_9PSED|nr:hypothetical protein [Pseudomonas extremaustralis]EZI26363.1 hypothetical protein PE143B_0121495 [Pseudomonas extremaustralis 14-3 substr. 14-3b]TWS01645.1 hypothetical protein FIV36_23725 [Pseudomonas extremaustralis]SDE60494.1 hypothetical protein SAMN05216591_0350 [Pseudomonas extremaustralis]
MPTHQDETLPQRYAREHQDYLKLCGSMTAEQVADLQLQLNNSMAREQALQVLLTAADERADVLEVLVGEVLDAVGREPLDLDAVLRLRARMRAALKSVEGGGDDTTLEEDREDFKKVFIRTNTKQGQSISLADMIARYEKKP